MPPFSQVQICMRSVHVQILDSLDSVVVDALGLALTAQADALPSRQFSPYFLRFVQFLRQPPHDLLMRSFISPSHPPQVPHRACALPRAPRLQNRAWTFCLYSREQSIFYTPAGGPSRYRCCRLFL